MPKKRIKINRLFLIGNGFDLSLGLKTKYSDFLLWLLKKEIIKAINSGIRIAPTDKYQGAYNELFRRKDNLFVNGYSENNLFDVIIEKSNRQISIDDLNDIQDIKKLIDFLKTKKIAIIPAKNSLLMEKLIENDGENWVDIENIYFQLLKKIKRNNTFGYVYKKDLEVVNYEFDILKEYLIIYLKEIEVNISIEEAYKYFNHFNSDILFEDFLEFDKEKESLLYENNYFLNFNYTASISKVLANFKDYKFKQNFIHGNLENEEIIFGFGDEMDSIYKEIEELNDNKFFKHIKSFHYFKTSNQRNLQTFLNSGFYQVFIYGHSCGLSDRVMLNEIFEHDNCKSIKIYYYNDEDFTTKTMEISRHFKSNQMMRKKIVDKGVDCLIPQVEK